MATLAELERALVNADAAGDAQAARLLAAAIRQARQIPGSNVPGPAPGDVAPAATQPINTAPQSIGQQALGALETGATLATGATTGALGLIGGTGVGLAEQLLAGQIGTPESAKAVEQRAMQGAQLGTFQPRTAAGQQQVQAIGGVLQNLPPVVGVAMAPGAVAPALASVAPAGQAAATAARAGGQAVRQRLKPVQEAFAGVLQRKDESAFGAGSVGAAEAADAAVRRETAAQLPVPFEGQSALTQGQATRNFEQLQFEKETAKRGDIGAPLRARSENQTETLVQNWDSLVDRANPVTLEPRELGKLVDRAVVNKANYARKRTDAAYNAAREAGEMEAPVQMDALAQRLAELERFEGVAPNLGQIRKEAARLGAIADTEGQIVGQAIKLNDSELLRQFVNEATDWTDRRQALMARRVNDAIDAATETAGGELYKKARKLRREFAQEFENTGLTAKLLGTKGKTDERAIAFDDVFRRIIVDSPLEEVNKLRRTLLTAGPDGRDAWQSLKAKTIDNIKESAFSASQTDSRGNPLISPDKLAKSIQALDREGKLESLFGKKQAQTMRDLADIAKVIYTAPPGAINTSNTASALQVALDSVATFGVSGIPVPAVTALREASKYLKNRKVAQRIAEALKEPRPKVTQPAKF